MRRKHCGYQNLARKKTSTQERLRRDGNIGRRNLMRYKRCLCQPESDFHTHFPACTGRFCHSAITKKTFFQLVNRYYRTTSSRPTTALRGVTPRSSETMISQSSRWRIYVVTPCSWHKVCHLSGVALIPSLRVSGRLLVNNYDRSSAPPRKQSFRATVRTLRRVHKKRGFRQRRPERAESVNEFATSIGDIANSFIEHGTKSAWPNSRLSGPVDVSFNCCNRAMHGFQPGLGRSRGFPVALWAIR
jgi:hypothetical protein